MFSGCPSVCACARACGARIGWKHSSAGLPYTLVAARNAAPQKRHAFGLL